MKFWNVLFLAIIGFWFIGCTNDSSHDCGDIYYEHNTVYGICSFIVHFNVG